MDPIFTQPQPFESYTPTKTGGMFGGGKFGIGQAIVAALNGYLAGRGNPVGLQNMKMMAAIRQRQLERQQSLEDYNRKRSDDNTDYVAHLQQQAQYNPKEPHYFQDNSGNEMAIGPDGQPTVVYKDPNPWRLVPNGMGGVIPVNMDALMRGGSPGMPAPGMVVPDPRRQGGPSPSGSGGFPY
jgi:hypothetical protein